jgi:acyl-CoA thioester hydrolase
MVDITYFANKVKLREQSIPCATKASHVEQPRSDTPGAFPVTFRGIVYPWHIDHMGHMNVQHYVGMFDQASWVLLAWLGLDGKYFSTNHRGMAALEQSISYKCELRTGDIFEIRSSILEVREKIVQLRHDMYNVNSDILAASTTILAVHLDTDTRKSLPLPLELRERARAFIASPHTREQEVALCEPVGV